MQLVNDKLTTKRLNTMDLAFKNEVMEKWEKYFPGQEQPIAAFYADTLHDAKPVKKPADNARGYTCLFSQIGAVHRGEAVAFAIDTVGCFGGVQTLYGGPYLKEATEKLLIDIEHFKKDACQVASFQQYSPKAKPTGKYFILKPFSTLTEDDDPEIVCIFAKTDVISALHALVGYEDTRIDSVITPFTSGCEQMFLYSLSEKDNENPRSTLGGMDPAMRKCIKQDTLTFSTPMKKFRQMVGNMDESFLSTYIWDAIKPRLNK